MVPPGPEIVCLLDITQKHTIQIRENAQDDDPSISHSTLMIPKIKEIFRNMNKLVEILAIRKPRRWQSKTIKEMAT